MAIAGNGSRATLTFNVSDVYSRPYVSAAYRWQLFTNRNMVDLTPIDSRWKEFVGSNIQWSVRFWGYLDVNIDPGFFNVGYVGSITCYTSSSGADTLAGSCWVESLDFTTGVDEPVRIAAVLRGTGSLTITV